MEYYDIDLLYKDLFNNKIVVYGNGRISKNVIGVLEGVGIFPEYIIVTSVTEHGNESIPVFSIDEKKQDILKRRIIVVIAVENKGYINEIEDILSNNKINSYVRLLDYRLDGERVHGYWSGLSRSHCIHELEDRAKLKHASSMNEESGLLIIVNTLTPRTHKLLKGIKKHDKHISIMLMDNLVSNSDIGDQYKNDINEVVCYKNAFETLLYILNRKYKAIWIVSSIQHNHLIFFSFLILLKKLFPPIVYEEYDVAKYYNDVSEQIVSNEKYCIENADIVVDRAFEITGLIDKYNYELKGTRIQVMDSCDSDQEINIIEKQKGDLSIVFAGALHTEMEYPDFPGACWINLAKLCEKNSCHLHIYPSVQQWEIGRERRFREIQTLARNSSFLHLHEPVQYKILTKTLSQYDYGIFTAKSKEIVTGDVAQYTCDKLIYAPVNNFFDYIDSGLPIVACLPMLQAQYFEKWGICLNWSVEDFDFVYLRNNVNYFKSRITKFRAAHQMYRLIKPVFETIQFDSEELR